MRKQKFVDLLEYSGSNPWKSRKSLLSQASKQFASGETLYSIIKDDCLAHWGWLTKGGNNKTKENMKNQITMIRLNTEL